VGFIALMAGALFYAARLPVEAPARAPDDSALTSVASPAPATGPVYPTFALPDLAGEPRRIGEWSGKHLLLNFWATWCAPCRREIPLLKAFQDSHGERYQVIGIAVDFVEPVQAYAEATDFNYPVLVGQEDAMAVAETSGVEFIGMPFTMIVAADGELLNAHIGEIHQEDLDHIVEVISRLDNGEIDKDSARTALESL
jgi:thiol-disulfide isomerase/thioredoxin